MNSIFNPIAKEPPAPMVVKPAVVADVINQFLQFNIIHEKDLFNPRGYLYDDVACVFSVPDKGCCYLRVQTIENRSNQPGIQLLYAGWQPFSHYRRHRYRKSN